MKMTKGQRKRFAQGIRAKTREEEKEPLLLAPIKKRVKIISKQEPVRWFRAVNRPGYVFSSDQKVGRIALDGRWMEIQLLAPNRGVYGDRVTLYHDGKPDRRNIGSTLHTAEYLDSPSEPDVVESIRESAPPPPPPPVWQLTPEQDAWFKDNFPKRGHEAYGFPTRIYPFMRDLPAIPLTDEQLRRAIGNCYEGGRASIDARFPLNGGK